MKSIFVHFLLLLSGLFCCLPASAQSPMDEPNWSRNLALQTAYASDEQAALKPLFQMARDGDNQALLIALSALQEDTDLSAPATDYLLYRFAIGLSDLDAGVVDADVLDMLSGYETRTLVPHDDHSGVGVPLFNVRAATAGARHSWERQSGSAESQRLLQNPDAWIERYLASSSAGRRGFTDALVNAPKEQLTTLSEAALERLQSEPELTLVAATAALQGGDLELLWQSIEGGGSNGLAGLLASVSSVLSATERVELMTRCLNLDSDTKKALAIAQLAPDVLNEPGVSDLMFKTLNDKNLGSAAALVLGASSDPLIIDRLRDIASKQKGLAQQRASLAINLQKAEGRTAQ